MRNSRLHWLFPALALCAAPAFAAVSVSFSDPARFTDIEASSASDRQQTLDDITNHLVRLGERYLPRGEALAIEVLDVDLAGRFALRAQQNPCGMELDQAGERRPGLQHARPAADRRRRGTTATNCEGAAQAGRPLYARPLRPGGRAARSRRPNKRAGA